jgi:hypothetical protein
MTNTDFTLRKKNGINHISIALPRKARETRFGIIDGVLVVGFLAALTGLVFLLSK